MIDVVSHLILQIHLGSTGEEKLYYMGMSTATGQHECSPASLENNKTVVIIFVIHLQGGPYGRVQCGLNQIQYNLLPGQHVIVVLVYLW